MACSSHGSVNGRRYRARFKVQGELTRKNGRKMKECDTCNKLGGATAAAVERRVDSREFSVP